MSNRTLRSGAITAVLVLGAFIARPASSADLGGYFAAQQDPVEFGSGWYIRGDLAATRIPSITTNTPATPTPANININPSAPSPIVARGSNLGYDADLGFGYKFNQWFRADMTGNFHQPVSSKFNAGNGAIFCPTGVSYQKDALGNYITSSPSYTSGGCTGTYTARLNSYDVMVNGYADLGTWYNITPYVGAGAGLGFGRYVTTSSFVQSNNVPYRNISFTDPAFGNTYTFNYDRTASGTFYNFAWSLMGGVAIDVFPQTKLDIGYRYLDLGSISGVSGKLTSQEVHAGLRYLIDR